LPAARTLGAPLESPAAPPVKKEELPPEKAAAPPPAETPSPKLGFGARLMQSFRGAPPPPASAPPTPAELPPVEIELPEPEPPATPATPALSEARPLPQPPAKPKPAAPPLPPPIPAEQDDGPLDLDAAESEAAPAAPAVETPAAPPMPPLPAAAAPAAAPSAADADLQATPPPPPPAPGGEEILPPGDSATELVISRPAPAASAEAAQSPAPAPATAPKSFPPAVAGLAAAVVIGGVSLVIGYRLTRTPPPKPEPVPDSKPAATPTAPGGAPNAPSATPASPAAPAARATFGDEHVLITGPTAGVPAAPTAPAATGPAAIAPIAAPLDAPVAPTAAKPAAAEEEPVTPKWTFRGTAFDLMTGQPVFAAKLTLLDAKGKSVGEVETGTNGRFTLTVPAGDKDGYTLKVSHTDYLSRCIDQGENTLSLRQATPEDRQVLIHAAHSRAWIGSDKSASVHDLALIPLSAENQ